HQLPLVAAHGALLSVGPAKVAVAAYLLGFAGEDAMKIATCETRIVGRDAGGGCEGRQDVGMMRDRVADAAGLGYARPAHQRRQANAAFKHAELRPAQAPGRSAAVDVLAAAVRPIARFTRRAVIG